MNRLERLRLKMAHRGLRWVGALPEPGTPMTKIRGLTGLVPYGESDGALLIWIFDEKPGAHPVLAVRLTEDEADRVYSADPYSVGVLEPVRRRIVNRWGLLIVVCEKQRYARPYRIPRRGSEANFIADLDKAAESCPAFALEHSRATETPEVHEFVERVATGLVLT
jgi:hypothetical protein